MIYLNILYLKIDYIMKMVQNIQNLILMFIYTILQNGQIWIIYLKMILLNLYIDMFEI